jgi:hypothetical protein
MIIPAARGRKSQPEDPKKAEVGNAELTLSGGLDGNLRPGIVGEAGIDNGVGDLVADLVCRTRKREEKFSALNGRIATRYDIEGS